MATEFCQRCKQSHAGRICDYDDGGECAETRAGESEAVVLDEQDPAMPPSKERAQVTERQPN